MRSEKGFSLVELIIAIVIGGVLFYSLLSMFANTTTNNAKDEFMVQALYLANEKLETVSSKPYSSVADESLISFPGSFNMFKSVVLISNVSSIDLDTNTGASTTGYKKITVRVMSLGLNLGTVEVSTLITDIANP